MEKKNLTFFIVSNDAEKTFKFTLPIVWVKTSIIVLIIAILAVATASIDYVGLLVQTAENKRLKAENAQLSKQFQTIESQVSALESSLDRVKNFATKLKLITNIEGEDRSLKIAMGATPPPGKQVEEFDMPMDQRPPNEEIANQEVVEEEGPPVDEKKGELVADKWRDYETLIIRIEKGIKEAQLREQSVIDLWETLSERQSLLNSTPNIRPAKGWFTSKFGYRTSPFTGRAALHAGLDIAAAPGSPIYAPADGVVVFAGYDVGYGKMVTIDHGYGVTTRYGHNAQIYVQVGQRVSRWDVIASVGNTGRSTGPHLHYEVRVNGAPRDPSIYILDE
jgi:murein DD-endopeptidase MepM/ murein hydrolase activator NlpD